MPTYDKERNELTFTSAESEPACCPICGAMPDYGNRKMRNDWVEDPWRFGECGSAGIEHSKLVFQRHCVKVETAPPEIQREYAEIKTLCINGPLRVGDLVLSTVDDCGIPCLPGVVKAIDLLGTSEHESENGTDDVHVDFTGDYGERSRREIVEAYAHLYGYERP